MNEATIADTSGGPYIGRSSLWFGMLGGAFAWLAHLIGAALMSEWGCIAGWDRYRLLGVSAVAWMILVLSLVTLAIAGAATWAAYRSLRRLRRTDREPPDSNATDTFLAHTGLRTSGLFVLIILVESVPVLYYLSEC